MFENVIADMLSVSGVKGVFIVDRDGALIEAESMFSGDDEVYAALIADAFNKASEVLGKISSDEPELVMIDGKKDRIIASKAGDLVFRHCRQIRKRITVSLKIEIKKAVEKITAMV
uniref:Roadblock/LAMTOR2 domain-containing protein n=1 Tax=Archaeoglobus fulgidus TaxID=2234 RepID=A0A7C2NDN6_ARCFL